MLSNVPSLRLMTTARRLRTASGDTGEKPVCTQLCKLCLSSPLCFSCIRSPLSRVLPHSPTPMEVTMVTIYDDDNVLTVSTYRTTQLYPELTEASVLSVIHSLIYLNNHFLGSCHAPGALSYMGDIEEMKMVAESHPSPKRISSRRDSRSINKCPLSSWHVPKPPSLLQEAPSPEEGTSILMSKWDGKQSCGVWALGRDN